MAERDYADEYRRFHSSEKSKKDRASRNKARRLAEALGRVRRGDGKDVHHVNGNPRDNSPGNTKVISASKNRAMH